MLAGQEAKARMAAKEVLRIQPEFSLEQYQKTSLHKDQPDRGGIIEELRKAGLK